MPGTVHRRAPYQTPFSCELQREPRDAVRECPPSRMLAPDSISFCFAQAGACTSSQPPSKTGGYKRRPSCPGAVGVSVILMCSQPWRQSSFIHCLLSVVTKYAIPLNTALSSTDVGCPILQTNLLRPAPRSSGRERPKKSRGPPTVSSSACRRRRPRLSGFLLFYRLTYIHLAIPQGGEQSFQQEQVPGTPSFPLPPAGFQLPFRERPIQS